MNRLGANIGANIGMVIVGLFASMPWAEPDAVGVATAYDGDSIRIAGILHRVAGIDAPGIGRKEWTNDGGPNARAYMAHLVRGRVVRCRVLTEGRFERPIAVCVAAGPGDLGAAMVRAGWAKAIYMDRARRDWVPYLPLERAARAARRGLWADPPSGP